MTAPKVALIIQTTRSIAGQDANVWLYGSRLDDTRRGTLSLECGKNRKQDVLASAFTR